MALDLGELVAGAKLDDSEFRRGAAGVRASLGDLKRDLKSIGVTKARIDADDAQANAKVKALKAEMAGLDKQVKLGVITREASERIAQVKAELAAVSDARVKIGVDSAAASAQVLRLKAEIARLDHDDATIDVKVRGADGVNFAFRGVSMLITAIVGLAPIAVPVFAAVAAGAGVMGSALMTAGAAGGVFAASVIGQVTEMKKAQDAMKTQAKAVASSSASQADYKLRLDATKKGTSEYAAALKAYNLAAAKTELRQEKLTSQQKDFNQTFGPAAKGLSNVKSAWAAFLDATRPTTVRVMGDALNVVAGILPRLVPLANAGGRAVGGLVRDIARFSRGREFSRILHLFESQGPAAITAFGHIAGNVILGLFHLFGAFTPYQKGFLSGFEAMTASFRRWSQGFGSSDGFHRFMDYVHAVLPQVGALFSNLAEFAGKFVVALGPLAGIELKGLLGLLEGLNALPPGVLTAIAFGITAIVLGLKAWEIGTKAVTIVQGVAAAASKAWAAAQWLLNAAMDANPIGLVVIAVAALVAGLIWAYKHSETFRNIVNSAFSAVKHVAGAVLSWLGGAVKATVGFVRQHWRLLVSIIGGPLVAVVLLVQKHWTQIRHATTTAWNAVVGFVRSVPHRLLSFFLNWTLAGVVISHWSQAKAGTIRVALAIVAWVRGLPGRIVSGLVSLGGRLASLASGAFGRLRDAATSRVSDLLAFVRSIPGRVAGAIGNLGGLLYNAGRSIVQGLINGVEHMIGSLVSKLHHLTSLIPIHKGPLSKDRVLLRPAGVAIMSGLIAGLDDGTGPLLSKLQGISARVAVSAPRVGPSVTVATGLPGATTARPAAGMSVTQHIYDRSGSPQITARDTARHLAFAGGG